MKVMYPGSFDPITIGHIDLIERCAHMFEHVVVAIMTNENKVGTFSPQERLQLVEASVSHLNNVSVEIGTGLTVDFAKKMNCNILVRGIRAVMDYEYELQHAISNRLLGDDIETIFLVASPKYSYVSSSVSRTVALYGGDLKPFVPDVVAEALRLKYASIE